MRVTLKCANVNHAARVNQPGWADVLGYTDLPDNAPATAVAAQGALYVCGACSAHYAEATTGYGLRIAARQAADQAHLPNPPDPGPPPSPFTA